MGECCLTWVGVFVLQGTRGPGYQSNKVTGVQGTWVTRYQGSRVAGIQGTRVPGFQGTRAPGVQGSRGPGNQGSRVPGVQGTRGGGYRRVVLHLNLAHHQIAHPPLPPSQLTSEKEDGEGLRNLKSCVRLCRLQLLAVQGYSRACFSSLPSFAVVQFNLN